MMPFTCGEKKECMVMYTIDDMLASPYEQDRTAGRILLSRGESFLKPFEIPETRFRFSSGKVTFGSTMWPTNTTYVAGVDKEGYCIAVLSDNSDHLSVNLNISLHIINKSGKNNVKGTNSTIPIKDAAVMLKTCYILDISFVQHEQIRNKITEFYEKHFGNPDRKIETSNQSNDAIAMEKLFKQVGQNNIESNNKKDDKVDMRFLSSLW